MSRKEFLYDYIHSKMIGVLATMGTGKAPESAVMEFGDTPELELIFDTLKQTRKYVNLKMNSHVSFVIGWENGETVQYEGVAEELLGAKRKKYSAIMFKKNPSFARWELLPGMTYFKVTPRWIRFSAMEKKAWEITFPF